MHRGALTGLVDGLLMRVVEVTVNSRTVLLHARQYTATRGKRG